LNNKELGSKYLWTVWRQRLRVATQKPTIVFTCCLS